MTTYIASETTTRAESSSRKRGCLFYVKRGLLAFLIILIGLPLTGVVYQFIGQAVDQNNIHAPGRLLDIGGKHLHLYCTGEGSPTVILENGHSAPSSLWAWVQQGLSQSTRVCSYDRLSGAWSDSIGSEPRDGQQIATELHTLLQNAQIEAPYILAGHSWGGLLIRVYRDRYPEEVAGMALVDSTHPDEWFRPNDWSQIKYTADKIASVLTWIGVTRLAADAAGCNGGPCNLPPQARAAFNAWIANNRFWEGQRAEFAAASAVFAQVNEAAPLDDLPLVVISAWDGALIKGERVDSPVEQSLQTELVELSSNRVHIVIGSAMHLTMLSEANYAQQVSDGILRLVEAVRSGEPLAQ